MMLPNRQGALPRCPRRGRSCPHSRRWLGSCFAGGRDGSRATRARRDDDRGSPGAARRGGGRDGPRRPFRELSERGEFLLRYAASSAEAARILKELAVVLLIAAPEVPTIAVNMLLAAKVRLRPELPVLVIRNRQAEEPSAWARRGVGVLRCPLLPAALSRSVDVVLGLAGR
ncbi:MAG: hypothetical protein ACJ79O_17355 [Myxococcales bacterium]